MLTPIGDAIAVEILTVLPLVGEGPGEPRVVAQHRIDAGAEEHLQRRVAIDHQRVEGGCIEIDFLDVADVGAVATVALEEDAQRCSGQERLCRFGGLAEVGDHLQPQRHGADCRR